MYEPFKSFSKRSVIEIMQNRKIYKFRISDLLKHINLNLLFTSAYIHEPQISKNPYNNIEFGLHDYYNIYLKAKESDYIIPTLFHLFYLEHFNVKDFTNNNYPIIRDTYIQNNFNTMAPANKEKHIRKMLLRNKNIFPNIIDPNFPREILIEALGHVLKDYMFYKYSLNDAKSSECLDLYKKHLFHINNYNPMFGRKKLLRNPYSTKRSYTVTFETNYPKTTVK